MTARATSANVFGSNDTRYVLSGRPIFPSATLSPHASYRPIQSSISRLSKPNHSIALKLPGLATVVADSGNGS